MSTYRASVRVEDDMLHTARPLTAPHRVATLIDDLAEFVGGSGGAVTSVDLTIGTREDSGTPIGDDVVGTTSSPLPGGRRAEDVDPVDGTPYLTEPASLAEDAADDEDVADDATVVAPSPTTAGQQ